MPAGLLHVVPGGAQAAREVVDAGADQLCFTGGSPAGRTLYGLQAARGRPAVLELSGRHVTVVLAGADIGPAARGIVWSKLQNGGRNCVSVQLVLAEAPVAEALAAELRRVLAAVSPADYASRVSPDDARRLRELVEDAVARGARVAGGETGEGGLGPVLVTGVAAGMRVVDEEVQGGILAVAAVASAGEAVAWINGSEHRLSATVWAADTARARRVADRLDVGQVWVNEELAPTAQPAVPLAGRGSSGFGASRGLAGLFAMVQPKVVSETPRRTRRRYYFPIPPGADGLFRETVRLAFAESLRGRVQALGALGLVLVRLARRHG
jgi:acyl-CoA reductase-like NAD-dependent aldehyde dehydrogenase